MDQNKYPIQRGRKICVSIAGENTADALEKAQNAAATADVLEIRLDSLANCSPAPFLDALDTPLLFTNRPEWEGGNFKGEEEERISLLEEAVQAGASYIDIELRTMPSLRDKLIQSAADRTQSIVSWHDFDTTPANLELFTIIRQMQESGADIGKLVTTAHTFQDVLHVLSLQIEAAELDFPLIAFCMGKQGMISRVATLGLGGFMTYASPDGGQATAPGQLPAGKLRAILKDLDHGN